MSALPLKRVSILTNFSDFQAAYSLNIIVQGQIKMLVNHGYQPVVIVSDTFTAPEDTPYHLEGVTLKFLPIVPVYNEVKKDETFDEDVQALEMGLEDALKDIDVVLSHDIIYQNACLKHNLASRKYAAKHPQVKWLHWIHSATSPITLANLRPYFGDEYLNLVQKPFPNSLYVFFNDYSKPRIAMDFGIDEALVKTVHHPTDVYEFFGIAQEVQGVMEDKKMLESDVMCTYPIRLDRGKQVQYVIKTMACLKEQGLSVRVVVVDFHSTGGDKVTYRDELKSLGIDWGLNNQELIFTSETRPEWEVEVPHYVVRDFQMLSNVFIMPSQSESYSLITQEAGLLKQVVVANFDFPPFRDIFGPNLIYRKYSSMIDIMNGMQGVTTTQYGPNEAAPEERAAYEKRYHQTTAGMIRAKLKDGGPMELSRFLLKNRNPDVIFRKELEPLLFL